MRISLLLLTSMEEITLQLPVTPTPQSHNVIACGNHGRKARVVEEAVGLRRREEKMHRAAIMRELLCDLLREVDVTRGEVQVHVVETRGDVDHTAECVVIRSAAERLLLEGGKHEHVGIRFEVRVTAGLKRVDAVSELAVGIATRSWNEPQHAVLRKRSILPVLQETEEQ